MFSCGAGQGSSAKIEMQIEMQIEFRVHWQFEIQIRMQIESQVDMLFQSSRCASLCLVLPHAVLQ